MHDGHDGGPDKLIISSILKGLKSALFVLNRQYKH